MANKALNIKDRLAVRGAIVEPSSMIGGNYLFSLQPHIEGGNLDGALNLTSGARGSYTIETIDDPDAPYGKVVKFPTGQQVFVAAYDIDVPVDAGDRVYMELTYMIPATDTGTDSRMYLGFNGFDKDKKKINSNFGLITYVVNNLQLTADGDWRTIGGYATIPSSHTPYNGSDGGAVRYIKNYVLVNYSGGDREVYISNLVVRKVDTFKDDADVSFSGNVGIGTDDPSVDLEVKNVDTNPVVRVSNDGGVLAEPRLQLYRNSGDYGQLHFEAGGGSNSGLHITNFRASNSQIIFNTEGDNERMRISTDGEVGIGTTLPQSRLHIHTGDGGTYTPNTNHDDLTIEGSTNIGLQLFSPSNTYQYIAFGDPSSVNAGYIRYYHGNNEMVFRTNGGDKVTINSTGDVRLHSYGSGSNTGTAAYTLAVDASGNIIETSGGGSTPTLQEVTTAGNTTTDDVGIQMSNPVSALHVGDGNNTISSALYTTDIVNVSAQNTAPGINIISAGTSQYNRGVFKATRAKGSLATPLTVSNNDYVFSLLGAAYNGTANYATAGVEMFVDGNVTATLVPQRIEFQTGTGTSRTTRMTIKSSGDVKVGGGSPSAKFHILSKGITSATTSLLVENSAGTDLLKVTDDGAVQLGTYGSGTFTGTAAYTLAVDSSGNIIETSGGGGGTPDLDAVTTAGNTTTNSITIGSATAGTAKVNIVGADATDANDALLVENSSGNDLFKITNSGNFYMKHPTRSNSIIINNFDTTGTGASCTLLGDLAGYGSNMNGNSLTAIGRNAAYNSTGGASSVTIGAYAASSCGNLFNTVAIGSNAGRNAGNAYYNVAIGGDACNGSSLRYSVCIGGWAGKGTGTSLQDRNIYIGYQTAYNSNLNDGNTVIGARLQSGSTEGLSNTVIIGSDNAERLRIDSTGKFKFDNYGSGSFTGTATVNLEADSSGNVIERLEERGSFSGTTDSSGRLNISHSIGSTPTIAMITTDVVSSSTIVTASVISKSSTTVTIITNQASTAISGYYIFSE